MKFIKCIIFFALVIVLSIISVNADVHAETVNATEFGVTADEHVSQTNRLHNAMRYFYDRGVEGTVYLPAGTYYVAEELRFHAGVHLVGDGIGQTVIKKMGSGSSYVVGNPILHGNSDDLNVSVSNITFDADRTNRSSEGLSQVGGFNINAKISNLTLDSIEIKDATNGAILRRMRDSVITNSVFDQTSGHSIATGAENYPVGEFTNVEITDNLITNSVGGSGINLSRATYTTVRNNQVINTEQQNDSYGGIRIPNGGANNIVEDNVIQSYPRGIFVLTGATNNTITGNTIIDSRIHGILVQADGNTFTNNTIVQNSLNPESIIRLAPGSNNTVADNIISTYDGYNNPGIRLTGNSSHNNIINNSIDTNGTLVSNEAGSSNTISGNTRFHSPSLQANTAYQLVNRHSGKLLEVAEGDTSDGANVQQWTSNGCSCQNWSITRNGVGYYNIVNQNSSKSLDVYEFSAANGANIVQWSNLNGTNQQWSAVPNKDGYVRFINRHSGKALEVEGRSNDNGGNVVQWQDNKGANQQWSIVSAN
ncbi:RICIN domain-containing protein [Gracilibacillus sp. S3-1-1]|uniref:RICIN domain-containing protein n=1 Tax=Gracilibacillus pellucidus TaxID=3095368 RepID=A0ACC6M7Y7_9BACI|nr:RICIN domain-containing protein [Gracilibacillus sp. S3-1-1]MDX8046887.1 RICIN domain-containing protein [Gracilibacillus sp. S3-1-1]